MSQSQNWHWTYEPPAGRLDPMPTFADVRRAARVIAPHLPPTPTWSYPALDAVTRSTVHVKHENAQPTGAFKVRGALNLLAGVSEPVVTYSTGNHARAVAYARTARRWI